MFVLILQGFILQAWPGSQGSFLAYLYKVDLNYKYSFIKPEKQNAQTWSLCYNFRWYSECKMMKIKTPFEIEVNAVWEGCIQEDRQILWGTRCITHVLWYLVTLTLLHSTIVQQEVYTQDNFLLEIKCSLNGAGWLVFNNKILLHS